MKKIAVILCVLLSLLMIVSCAEPDNKPDAPVVDTDAGTGSGGSSGTGGETVKPDVDPEAGGETGKPDLKPGTGEDVHDPALPDRDIEFVVSLDAFDEAFKELVKKIGFRYRVVPGTDVFSELEIKDPAEDGTVNLGMIHVKSGSSLDYEIYGIDEGGNINEYLIKRGNVLLDEVENKFVFYCESVEDEGWKLARHEDGKWFVQGYTGSENTLLTIPATIGGRSIHGVETFIYDGAELIIADGIKTVGRFGGKMKKITIPSSVIDMGTQYTLRSCSELETAIIKASVELLPPGFLHESTSIISVELPEGLKTIGQEAFKGCTGLRSIALPGSIETIGAYAFSKCTSLTSLAFPESLKIIGIGAFMESGLTDVDLTYVSDLYEGAFYGSGLKTLKIPSTITEIKADFENGVTGPFGYTTNGPVSVTLTGTWTSIPDDMFAGIRFDDGFRIPDTVAGIGSNAFAYAVFKPEVENGTIAINLSADIVSIGSSAFRGTNIASIRLPAGLKAIPDWCFEDCSELESVTMPDAVESIGKSAFLNCSKVRKLDNLQNVGSLENSVFNGMTHLESLVLSDRITVLPGSFVDGCKALKSFVIPESVTELGSCCFQDSGLESLIVPASVKADKIGRYAFYGMEDCTSIELKGVNEADASSDWFYNPQFTVVYADTSKT